MRRKLDVLETSVKQLDDCTVELTITVDAEEVDRQINAVYRQAAKARIPGFRPGKAPRKVLENNFGGKEYFLATATEEIVGATAPLAIDAEGLVTLKEPEFGDFGLVTEGQQFTYGLNLMVSPRFALSSYDPVKIELPGVEATEEEILKQIDSLREYYVEYEDIVDRGIMEGDSVVISIGGSRQDDAATIKDDVATIKDDAADAESGAKEITYDLGSGLMPAGFDEGLKGMTVGQTKDIPVVFNAGAEDAGDFKPIDFTVTLKSIRTKVLPELTDAWVKNTIEYEGVAELRTRIAESVKEGKAADLPALRETAAVQKLSARLEGEPPEEMVKQTEQSNYRDFFKSLQDNRTSLDQYLSARNLTAEQFREQMREQAVFNATVALALDSLARHLELEVSDAEVLEEFEKSGAGNPGELYKKWKNDGRISEIRARLLRVKAAQHLYDTAEVFELGALKEAKAPAVKKPARKTTKAAASEPVVASELVAAKIASDAKTTSAKKPSSTVLKEPAENLVEKKPRATRTTAPIPAVPKPTVKATTVKKAPTRKTGA